jgi:cytochrome c553
MENSVRGILIALFVFTSFASAAAPQDERLQQCFACHGENGQSQTSEIPSLGAQTSPYLLIQLYLFREKQRAFEPMNEVTKDFTDEDLQTFSDIIAKLPAPKPETGPVDAARMEKAKALVQQYRCNFCHDANLGGRDNVPRIAGQREDYLVKTLREYKNNTRHGYDGSMAEVLVPISDSEIQDLAYYVSRQP